MAALPQDIARPGFVITVDGTALPVAAALRVSRISVEEDLALPSMVTVELAGGDADGETAWIDGDTFAVGAAVEVGIGYGDALRPLIAAEVTGLEPIFARGNLPFLTVRGYDRSHRLMRGRRTRSFLQQKDSDIAAAIAAEAGLTADVVDSKVTHDYVLQANTTDMEFLRERARRIQYEAVVEDKRLQFRPAQNSEAEVLTLSLEDDLLEFCPRLSTMGQVPEIDVRGWSAKTKKQIVASARSGDEVSTMGGGEGGAALVGKAFGGGGMLVSRVPVSNQAEADQLARAQFNRAALDLVLGEGACTGRADLHPGQVIKIEGVGSRFSGRYYVVSTHHSYSQRDPYQTRFVVRRNAT